MASRSSEESVTEVFTFIPLIYHHANIDHNAFRIAKSEYVEDLSGEGARLYGGRWNRKGTPVVYLADIRALVTVVRGEFNILLNPRHELAKKASIVSVEAFRIDARLRR